MKYLTILFLFFCTTQNESFIDKVVNDFHRYSCFISIKTNDSTTYIIENDDLFLYMEMQKSISKEEYIKWIKNKLISHSFIDLSNMDSKYVEAEIFKNIPSVDANAKKGKEGFIKTYFNSNEALKDGIPYEERTAIIQKLFEWEIACYIDDESGLLVISR